jgi:hypothetical protein
MYRLGPNGYSSITTRNTLLGGQQTNCRVNALANTALSSSQTLAIWYRTTTATQSRIEEARWMAVYGIPEWNLAVAY